MGQTAIYKCNKCKNEFQAHEGGGFCFIEFRCVNCDVVKLVKCNDRHAPPEKWMPPTKEEIGTCEQCGGELKNNLKPMCPKCKSRDVEEKEVLIYYD